jgi:anti-anti-sigma factor
MEIDMSEEETMNPPETDEASSGAAKDKPINFLDLDEIQELIDARWQEDEKGGKLIEARETLVVSLKGSLTMNEQQALRAYFEGRMFKSKLRRIILDLTMVEYIDSSIIGIFSWLKKSLSDGGSLKIMANSRLYELFSAMRMVDFLSVHHSSQGVEE